MNKEHFNKLVTDYTKLDGQFIELEKLVKQYPYSQPLRVLNAKSSSKQPKAEYHRRLTTAAFYATDRNVLRTLIETGLVPSDGATPTAQNQPTVRKSSRPTVQQPKKASQSKEPGKPAIQQPKKTGHTMEPAKRSISGETLREDVIHNLDELLIAKANFFKKMGMEETPLKARKVQLPDPKAVAKPSTTQEKSTIKATKTSPKKTSKSATRSPKTNKKELIDKFIETKPRITPNKVAQDNQSDLSRASSELKEDLVSENLALIFANQGKKAKAIEIYKKLIWKFPQKKASFAARIEELKKK